MSQFDPNNLDQNVVNLAKAIRQVESGNRAVLPAEGAGLGGASRYQYTTGTWKGVAQKYLGSADAPLTAKNEDQATYMRIKDWKDAGYTPKQIASMWNAGEGEPDAYTGKFSDGRPSVGVNDYGVKYSVPNHANKVYSEFVKFSKQNVPNKIVNPISEDQPEQTTLGKIGSFGKAIGNALISNERGLGETFATAGSAGEGKASSILRGIGDVFTGGEVSKTRADIQNAEQSQNQLDEMNQKLGDAIVAGKKQGKDTSKLEKLWQENTGRTFNLSDITSGAIDKTAGQIAGEAGGVALDIGALGTFGKAAEGAKTGLLLRKSPSIVSELGDLSTKIPAVGKELPKYGQIAKAGIKDIGIGAGIGYGYDVSQNLQQGKTGLDAVTPGLGTAIGAAIPGAVTLGKMGILAGREASPRIINSLIGANPEFNKAVRMGKDPGETVAKYGITGNNLEEFEDKISQARKEVGQIIGNTYQLPENAAKVADYSDVLKPIDDEIKKFKFSGSNRAYLERLQIAKSDILNHYPDLTKLNPESAHTLKQDLATLKRWTGSYTEDNNFGKVVNQMYGKVTNRVNELVPELTELNKDFGGLLAAEQSTASKAERIKGKNLMSPLGKFSTIAGGISGAGMLATGGLSIIPVLAGLSGAGLEKVLETTAFKSRMAKFLSGVDNEGVQAMLRGKTLADQKIILDAAKNLGYDFGKEVEKNKSKQILLKAGRKSTTYGTINLPPRVERLARQESGALAQPSIPLAENIARPNQLALPAGDSSKIPIHFPPRTGQSSVTAVEAGRTSGRGEGGQFKRVFTGQSANPSEIIASKKATGIYKEPIRPPKKKTAK